MVSECPIVIWYSRFKSEKNSSWGAHRVRPSLFVGTMERKKRNKKSKSRSPKNKKALAAKNPVTVQEARRQLVRRVSENSPEITKAVIVEARKGNYLPAKFLFEAAGLTGAPAEGEEAGGHEGLARQLMEQWKLGEETEAAAAAKTEDASASGEE